MIHERFLARVVDHLLALAQSPDAELNPDRGARLLVLALRCVSEARRITQTRPAVPRADRDPDHPAHRGRCRGRAQPVRGSAAVGELAGAVAVVRETGSGFPGRESYLAWYRHARLPDSRLRGRFRRLRDQNRHRSRCGVLTR